MIALVGTLAVIGANTLMRPVSRMINSRRGEVAIDDEASADAVPIVDYLLEARTNDKSEQRVRALVLQAVNRPEGGAAVTLTLPLSAIALDKDLHHAQ